MTSLPPTLNFAEAEEEICKQWKEQDTFKTQDALAKERNDPVYTFYDGPPFATGLPHYGHILAGTIKDTVTRYAVLTRHQCSRRAGWDCHGLPVEYEIDQMLNIKHRGDVLAMGIDKYNQECRAIVTRYTKEWERTVTRLGRWIDFENDYKTMDPTFMESVWWVFSQLFEKGLVYQGYKVMPFSTACSTPLSNFEAGLNYKDVVDPAVVVSFPIIEDEANASLLAWTTTPWTLPSNLALCVHKEIVYVKIKDLDSGNVYIMAKSRLVQLYPILGSKKYKGDHSKIFELLDEFKGEKLVGLRYEPLFKFFESPEYFQVVYDNYVTEDSGTGIVHQAPAFGEDDYRVCLANGIIKKGGDIPCPVDESGFFTEEVEMVKGVHVKKADNDLMAHLKEVKRLVQKGSITHSYPFCWRSDTPLIYKAVPSWFIRVEDIKARILENNDEGTYWVPSSVKEGRFHSWLKDARDWAVSRNRFWGTPMPIWANEDLSEVVCIGSREQLAELSGTPIEEITDLHREFMDEITIPSKKNPGQVLKRVDEVFDCWFESGSMPYAQQHYPFENKEAFEAGFPADFIAEGLDQTRGWFYTLQVLATALFDKPAFKNLICNGLVLAGDGKKMSKRLKNYPDPVGVIDKYGADALRMYLINSPVVRAESLKFQEAGVLGVVKEVFLPWYNAFRFFMQNMERWESASSNKFSPDVDKVRSTTNPTDIWISAATQDLIKFVHQEMDAYRLYTVMPALVTYINQLTNWYVRLNRDRLKGTEGDETDTEMGLQVLYDVLFDVTVIMAPFTPFITEYFYQHLRKMQPSYPERLNRGGSSNPVIPGKSDSVHFLELPAYDESRLNAEAVASMEALQSVVELGRQAREKRNISLRTPIKNVVAVLRSPSESVTAALTGPLRSYILSELNAWDFTLVPKEQEHEWVKLALLPNLSILGRKLGKKMKPVKDHIVNMTHADAVACMESGKLEVEGITIDSATELLSKLSFAKDGDEWEPSQSDAGDVVVGIDCTQDEAILSAGATREFINHVQQLRKAAGLDLSDQVEVFFTEPTGSNSIETALSMNVALLENKFKGSVPLPDQYAPKWSVVLGAGDFEVGESAVNIKICRPAVCAKPELNGGAENILSTLDPESIKVGCSVDCVIDGTSYKLVEGKDFWVSTLAMLKSNKSLPWL